MALPHGRPSSPNHTMKVVLGGREVADDNPFPVTGGGLTTEQQAILQAILDAGEASEKRFEWQDVTGEVKPLYIGKAAPGASESDPVWWVARWVFATVFGEIKPSVVNSAVGIAWDDRATELP